MPQAPVAARAPSGGPEPEAKAPNNSGTQLTVFAGAASLPALQELGPLYEKTTGAKVDITFGGSGAILTQFAQEHYGDVYIPGSDDFMDRAEKQEAVIPETRTILVYLVPAICVPRGNPKGIKELQDLSREGLRVVIGHPDSVCLGDLAKNMLGEQKLWDRVEPRIASYAESCEAVLNTLLLGESDVVIGWDVWERQHPDKVEAVALPAELTRTRNVPAAVIKWSKQVEEAEKFIAFLTSDDAKTVWTKHGYAIKPPPGG